MTILLTAWGVVGEDGGSEEQAMHTEPQHIAFKCAEFQNEAGTFEWEESTVAIELLMKKKASSSMNLA